MGAGTGRAVVDEHALVGGVAEVLVDLIVEVIHLEIVAHGVLAVDLLLAAHALLAGPLLTHVLDLLLVIELRVVVLADAAEALPEGKVHGVDGDAVVVFGLAGADVAPPALLLLEVKTGGVGEEQPGEDHTGETEPGNDVELGLGIDVVVENGGEKRTSLAAAGAEAVGGGADGGREDLTGNEEGDAVGAELVEEAGEEVHGLERLDTGGAGVVLQLEGGNDEHDEAHEETDLLHHLAAIEAVVHEERGEIITDKRDDDVVQVPNPAGQDRARTAADDGDELSLEELVSVEEDIVAEPATSRGEETASKVPGGHGEGIKIVTGNIGLLLGGNKLSAGVGHLVGSVVDEPKGTDGGNGERQSECPLDSGEAIGRGSATGMEDEEEDNEEGLVDKLTPTLHQEGGGNLAATVKTVVSGGKLSGRDRVLHGGGSSNGIFSTDTETCRQNVLALHVVRLCCAFGRELAVEEERPSIADNPALEGQTPRSREHEQTDKHDGGILNETPATTNPITNNTNDQLANHDTDNLEICYGSDPVAAALGSIVTPALRPGGFEERLDVADTEEDVALETKTGTGKDGVTEVPRDGAERVLLHHATDGLELLLRLLILDLVDEGYPLAQGQVGPVGAVFCVDVVRLCEVAEDGLLVVGIRRVAEGKLKSLVTGGRAVRHGDQTRRRVVVSVGTHYVVIHVEDLKWLFCIWAGYIKKKKKRFIGWRDGSKKISKSRCKVGSPLVGR